MSKAGLFVLIAEAVGKQPIDVGKTVCQNYEFLPVLTLGRYFRCWLVSLGVV